MPKHIRWSKQLAQPTSEIDIPGGTVARIDGYIVMHKHGAHPVVSAAHAHPRQAPVSRADLSDRRGASAKTEMINCANFNYNWHLNYTYTDDAAPLVPAGTILHVITWHDNSTANKANPDPKNWVGDGQRTIDEMGFAWIGWYDLTPTRNTRPKSPRARPAQKKATTTQAAAAAATAIAVTAHDSSLPALRRAARIGTPSASASSSHRNHISGRFRMVSLRRRLVVLGRLFWCLGALPGACAQPDRSRQQLQIQLRTGYPAGVRRLVQERRWQLHHALRLSQSELGRRSCRSRSAPTTASSPAVPIAGSRRSSTTAHQAQPLHRAGAERLRQEGSDLDAHRQRQDAEGVRLAAA